VASYSGHNRPGSETLNLYLGNTVWENIGEKDLTAGPQEDFDTLAILIKMAKTHTDGGQLGHWCRLFDTVGAGLSMSGCFWLFINLLFKSSKWINADHNIASVIDANRKTLLQRVTGKNPSLAPADLELLYLQIPLSTGRDNNKNLSYSAMAANHMRTESNAGGDGMR